MSFICDYYFPTEEIHSIHTCFYEPRISIGFYINIKRLVSFIITAISIQLCIVHAINFSTMPKAVVLAFYGVLIDFLYLTCFWDFCCTLIKAVMAGAAPEGSQFDARQYDEKMTVL